MTTRAVCVRLGCHILVHDDGRPVELLPDGLVTVCVLFVSMRVRCRRMFVGLFTMLVSRSCVMLSVLVFAARVMMLGLMMMMSGSVVMSSSRMMMFLRRMLL